MFPLGSKEVKTLRDIIEYIPPVLVSGGLFLGMDINEWIKVMTLVYVVVGTVCTINRVFFSKHKGE